MLRGLALRYGEGRGVRLMRYEESLQLCTRPQYREILEKVLQPVRRQTLTQAALETLAVVAYRQPITRMEVEQIRGVQCDRAMATLVHWGLIEERGRKETVGRPILYGTTEKFLAALCALLPGGAAKAHARGDAGGRPHRLWRRLRPRKRVFSPKRRKIISCFC